MQYNSVLRVALRAAASVSAIGISAAMASTALAQVALSAPAAAPAAGQATSPATASELSPTGFAEGLSPAQISDLAAEAFYWGMNIAGHYELRYVYSQMEQHPQYRGLNRLMRQYQLADATARYATTINASTLYSGGTFDVREEPVVVEADAVTDGRYWSVQASDQNANWFMMIGSQFTGNGAQRYVIVGPEWRGTLPAEFRGTQIIRATSNTFNIATRVGVMDRSPEGLAASGKVLDGVNAGPLSMWLKNGKALPPLPEQPKVKANFRTFPRMPQIVDYGRSMTAVDFLQLLSLSLNDPSFTLRSDSVKETQTLANLTLLGLRKGALVDPALITPEQVAAAQSGFDRARRIARAEMQKALIDMNGWKLQSSLFHNDLDYVAKSGADDVAWGTPVPFQSHTIGYLFNDANGKLLDGSKRYTLTIDLANAPPVTEFWELPIYDSAGYFIPNPINRNSVTSYQVAAGVFAVKDNKVTFYLQPDRPKDPEQARNWLPTAKGEAFQFAARFYGPKAGLVDGSYAMPPVVPVK